MRADEEDEDADAVAVDGEDADKQDKDFDPEKPNDMAGGSGDEDDGQIEDTFHDVEMDEESD